MKLTLNKFLLIFFLITSVLPIIGLSVIHINYLHKLLNDNQSFIKLIEREELTLFYVYVFIVVIGIGSCLILFKNFIVAPITNLVYKLDGVARGDLPEPVENSKHYLREVSQFIERFNQMIKILQDSKRQKSDFIATLTHDLKTPLLAEKKAFQLLKEYNLDSKSNEKIIDSLVHCNNDLVLLIDILMDNLKYESGEIKVNKSFNLSANSLFQQYLSSLYPLFQEKDIAIEVDIDPQATLSVDTSQFRRVISNLMFNALENSPSKTRVKVEIKDQDSQTCIKISDQGYGIPADRLENIFDRYCSTKDKPGAGLGLYVSKLIVEKHGGTISALSTINQGSSFKIDLPK